MKKLLMNITKNRRKVALPAILGFFILILVVNNLLLDTIDYSDVTIVATTSQGLVSIIKPNPRNLEDKIVWDTNDIQIDVTITMSNQIFTINSFTFIIVEHVYDDEWQIEKNQILAPATYEWVGNLMTIEGTINRELRTIWDDHEPTYWITINIIGVDYRGEFEVNMDYFYFQALTPADYATYYEDRTEPTAPIFETTTTVPPTTTIGTTTTEYKIPVTASGFEFISLALIIPFIYWRKRDV